jgi:pimeloyl-ACP methyl ester carboxylesterase
MSDNFGARNLTAGNKLSRRHLLTTAAAFGGGFALHAMSGCTTANDTSVSELTPGGPPAVSRNGVTAAPGMNTPKFLQTNGITLGVYDQGEGFPVVLCHGFPELAYSWRHQVKALTAAGYRAIAPDQRGYGLSDRPENMDQYTIKHLCGDMAGMLDALEIDRAVFCGHDWGGGVVWMMPRLHADRVAGVIGVNTPSFHPAHRRPQQDSPIVRTDNYYTNTFQQPGYADELLAADVRRVFDMMLRRGGFWDAEKFRTLPEDSAERRVDLLRMLAQGNFTGEFLLTEDEARVFVDTFESTGFTGGLNWYRAAAQVQPDFSQAQWDITVPCLYVGAENDVILPPSSADGMEQFIEDFERYTVADCGHWTQQEKPDELNRVMLDWLGRKYSDLAAVTS